MSEPCDVAVIGAGPAGAVAAHEAARRGASVLLVDKARFPRDKVCGCCIHRDALATLERIGLGGLVQDRQAVPLRSLHLASGGRTATLSLPGGMALSRGALDEALVQAAQAQGVTFRAGTAASFVARGETAHRLSLRSADGAREVQARVVVAADGLAGSFLRRCGGFTDRTRAHARMGAGVAAAGGPGHYRVGNIYMACGRAGYVGLVRLEDGRLDIAAAMDLAYVQGAGGPGAAAAAVLDEAGLPGAAWVAVLRWRGTPMLTHTRRPLAMDRVFLVGDAAGYVEPFTGEGIAWALSTGAAVAPHAVDAVARWSPREAQAWARVYRRMMWRRQARCRAVAMVLRRPRLVRTLLRVAGAAPGVARPIVERITAAEPAAE